MSPRLRNPNLTISPTPFKPSFLSIPPSPFSPRTPLTPLPRPINSPHAQNFSSSQHQQQAHCQTPKPPPAKPLSWQWQCHLCHRHYPLGTTRRCLDDGHHFCAGVTRIRTWRTKSEIVKKRVKRHSACGSEFDYAGWKGWRTWQRNGVKRATGRRKDCWRKCDYPSECRWGRRAGIHSPVEDEGDCIVGNEMVVEVEDDGPQLGDTCGLMRVDENEDGKHDEGGELQEVDIWSTLRQGMQRRKDKLGKSPLAPIEEEQDDIMGERDTNGDVVMQTIDPRLLELSSPTSQPIDIPARPVAPKTSAAADMLRGLMDSRKLRRRHSRTWSNHEKRRSIVPAISNLTVPRNREETWRREREEMLNSLAPLERMLT